MTYYQQINTYYHLFAIIRLLFYIHILWLSNNDMCKFKMTDQKSVFKKIIKCYY